MPHLLLCCSSPSNCPGHRLTNNFSLTIWELLPPASPLPPSRKQAVAMAPEPASGGVLWSPLPLGHSLYGTIHGACTAWALGKQGGQTRGVWASGSGDAAEEVVSRQATEMGCGSWNVLAAGPRGHPGPCQGRRARADTVQGEGGLEKGCWWAIGLGEILFYTQRSQTERGFLRALPGGRHGSEMNEREGERGRERLGQQPQSRRGDWAPSKSCGKLRKGLPQGVMIMLRYSFLFT